MKTRVDYSGRMADSYDRGRFLLPEAEAAWKAAATPFFSPVSAPILDVGSGTGRFSSLLAGWFDATVIGMEPAEGMRSRALAKSPHARVRYVGGAAEGIPLRNGSCGGAWISNAIHHFPNLDVAGRELRRVVRPGGPVLIRGAFADRPAPILMFDYFPEAMNVMLEFPTFHRIEVALEAAGFSLAYEERVPQLIAQNLSEFYERMRTRADSTLEAIDDEAFERGLARLQVAASAERTPTPVLDPLDLFVFR